MQYHFEQVDVFTKQRFAGNPLAVFTDAQGLTEPQMQSIANEMNLSETTFIVPPSRADCDAKYFIFTPDRQLPFAGHPTIGTAFVLARARRVRRDSSLLHLEAQVGKIPVRIEGPTDNPTSLFFTSPAVDFGSTFEKRDEIAAALGVSPGDLLDAAPVEEAGCPLLNPYVGLRSKSDVDRIIVNPQLLRKALEQDTPNGVYVFCIPARDAIYARFFSFQTTGTIEDPATGGAASPLGAYLVRNRLLDGGPMVRFTIEQGTKMGRQAFLHVVVEHANRAIHKVEVGGSAVPVLNGSLVI